MSAPLVFAGAGYRYPRASAPAIDGVDLVVEAGQLVLLTGPTGCGKSTLVRLAAGLLGRHGGGEIHGRVEVQGWNVRSVGVRGAEGASGGGGAARGRGPALSRRSDDALSPVGSKP